jgi:hypothetical protein
VSAPDRAKSIAAAASRWAPVVVGLAVTVGLVVRRQVVGPLWEPRGADWGMWYASVAWLFHDVQWPPVRWPLWGVSTALVAEVLPAPLHVTAMVQSMACTGVAAGATFALVRPIAGAAAAIAAVLLLALHPITLEMGSWLGAYAMWAATGPLAAAALAASVRSRSTAPWWVAGAAFGTCLAVQEKGILTAAGMVPAIGIALWLAPRRGRAFFALAAPGLVLALAYFLFPEPLASLDAQATLQSAGQPAPPPGVAAIDAGAPETAQVMSPTASTGWIFGRHMGPATLLALAQKGFAPISAEVTWAHRQKLSFVLGESFPGADPRLPWLVAVVGVLLLVGLLVRRRADLLVAVVALAGVFVSGYPALNSDFNLRFILAQAWVLPAAVGLALGQGRGARVVVPLVAAAILLGPFRQASTWQWDDSPLFSKVDREARLAGRIWLDLERDFPGVPVDVQSPFEGGALAVDGRDGRYLSGFDLAAEPVAADHWVIVSAPRAEDVRAGSPAAALGLTSAAGAPVALGARRVAAVWPKDDARSLCLLTSDPPP